MVNVENYLFKNLNTTNIDIIYNVCVPVDHLENSQVGECFNQLFQTAYQLMPDYKINNSDTLYILEKISQLRSEVVYKKDSEDTRIFAIPESVAQMASYTGKQNVPEMIYALLDFGAGTTDVSIFRLFRLGDNPDEQQWFAARNIPWGFNNIERVVLSHINQMRKAPIEDEIIGILNQIERMDYKSVRDDIDLRLHELWKETHKVWQDAYKHMAYDQKWKGENVRIFVSGGGCKLSLIKEIFKHSWMYDVDFDIDWGPYQIGPIPKPDDFNQNNSIPFTRFGVAYGLTYPEPLLGKYILPSEAPDVTPNPVYAPRIPSRDEIAEFIGKNWV
jgi:hypothetical protein